MRLIHKINYIVIIGSMILGLTACGNTDVKSSGKKENLFEETVSEKAVVEDEKELKKDTPKKQERYETEILTIQKVGELSALGEDENYVFVSDNGTNYHNLSIKTNYLDDSGKYLMCSWQGNPIGKMREVDWYEEGYFVKTIDYIEAWYNSDGEMSIDNLKERRDYEQYNLSNFRYVFIKKEDEEYIFDRKEGRYIPNLPVIDYVYTSYT